MARMRSNSKGNGSKERRVAVDGVKTVAFQVANADLGKHGHIELTQQEAEAFDKGRDLTAEQWFAVAALYCHLRNPECCDTATVKEALAAVGFKVK